MPVTLDDLESRLNSIPDALQREIDKGPIELGSHFEGVHVWDVTGVGASEGPARYLVDLLNTAGFHASYLPPSHFLVKAAPPTQPNRGLCIFSQGLSPNARLSLSQAHRYGVSVLFTSLTEIGLATTDSCPGAGPDLRIEHCPAEESGSLLRLVGPICASLASLRFACSLLELRGLPEPAWAACLHHVPQSYARALDFSSEVLTNQPVACLSLGDDLTMGQSLMWKWQEALYERQPLSFDLLSFAHGPLQSFYSSPATFLVLRRDSDPIHDDMWHRLKRTLVPNRHHMIALRAQLPGPLAFFEFDSLTNNLLLTEMRKLAIDPSLWPGKNQDGPLYSLSSRASAGKDSKH